MQVPASPGFGPGAAAISVEPSKIPFAAGVATGASEGFAAASDGTATGTAVTESSAGGASTAGGPTTSTFAFAGVGEEPKGSGDGTASGPAVTKLSAGNDNLTKLCFCYLGLAR